MPWPKGKPRPPTAGRKKGTPNRQTVTVQETLARLDCDPFAGMAQIALGKIPCGACAGSPGKNMVKAADGTFYPRTCESCYGTLLEKVSPETRAKMYAELARYIQPQRKAVDVSLTGADGGPIQHAIRVNYIKSPNAG